MDPYYPDLQTASPVETDASIKVMISRAAVRGWKLSLADVGSAYLEIDQPRDNVFIEMPRDVPAAMLEEAGFTPGVSTSK